MLRIEKAHGVELLNSLGNVWRRTAGAPNLSSFILSPVTVASGLPAMGTLQLSSAAPAGGVNITLSSSRPNVVAVPQSVAIPGSASSATFAAKTSQVTSNTTAIISATLSGGSGGTLAAHLTVVPPSLIQLTVDPSTINSGRKATATVFLDGLAPAGGAVVALTSGNASVAAVPSTVTIPHGAGSVHFASSLGCRANLRPDLPTGPASAYPTAAWKHALSGLPVLRGSVPYRCKSHGGINLRAILRRLLNACAIRYKVFTGIELVP
jgi:hypothetical protein